MYVCVIKLLGGKYDLAVSLSTFKFHLPLHEGVWINNTAIAAMTLSI